ncbi:aspartate aminotransferase family protein [Sulfobacillus thermosulfidooxidans]|uniref:aspartate aminotransferase family protein n=1 Tax=Sulfobacillus thermosulfidooxidans TaxID=28034 RepID=UPI0009F979D7|nr:aspartate aminotransferase family protein [Sulfobacillus thermosulfidooxidans]
MTHDASKVAETPVDTGGMDLIERQKRYLVPGISLYYQNPLTIVRGQDRYVYGANGERYLDFFGGILTVSVGHSHPKVVQAIVEQAQQFLHTSTLYLTKPMVDLAERLAQITPGPLSQSFFTTSGTEANETALVMAQLATGNHDIIALRHSYSGRSHMTMGLTGQADWKLAGGGMHLPIRHTHNAYCYRCPFGKTPDMCAIDCAQDLEEFIQTSTSGRIAALIAEPIQGVGGFITPPAGFFEKTVEITRRHGGLFIDDEVQTGFGRTGKPFGIEHYGVTPDIMTFAKGLANGMPIGATIATAEVAQSYRGPTISTFGGNPVSMQAALATLCVIDEEHLVENARDVGAILRAGLEELSDQYPVLGDVRGMGLMQGIEIVRENKIPAPELASSIHELAREEGLLLGLGGLYHNVLRIAPPLSVTRTEVQDALLLLKTSLKHLTEQYPQLKSLPPTRIHYR